MIFIKNHELTGIPITKLMAMIFKYIPDNEKQQIMEEYKKLYKDTLEELQTAYEYGLNEKIPKE